MSQHADVNSVDLAVPVSVFATGWQVALTRPPRVDAISTSIEPAPPRVVSVPICHAEIRTFNVTFPESPFWMSNKSEMVAKAPPIGSKNRGAHSSDLTEQRQITRIKPPSDVIKLKDRLYYVLQPPLESLIEREKVEFPFEPFPYQYQGIAFLYPRYSALLADEMGLGKTIQAISTIRLLLRAGELGQVLLICPKPLVSNWKREFNLWAPEIPVSVIEGDQQLREWQWRQPQTPVKIANYELVVRDAAVFCDEDLQFDLVVLDEAQRIKNRSSTTNQVVRSINRNRNWALTGTPVENSPDDLVGLFEFISPGYLSLGMSPRRMRELTKDHTLRRTKDMVLTDMPPKVFRDLEIALSPEQEERYRVAEHDGVINLTDMGEGITIQHVFELVLRLKQICNFDPATGASSKLERLEADLEEVAASGKKAIVFSQWVNTLDAIRDRLSRFGPLEYHGRIPSKRREGVIEKFRNDSSSHVILMSYGAGSVGLNLQFCEYVFLFDRWWNPAVEDQAINRAHRIGAAGTVTVTRLMTTGTIEERINLVLEEKRELFDTIFPSGEIPSHSGLTQDDIFGLFDLRIPKSPAKAA